MVLVRRSLCWQEREEYQYVLKPTILMQLRPHYWNYRNILSTRLELINMVASKYIRESRMEWPTKGQHKTDVYEQIQKLLQSKKAPPKWTWSKQLLIPILCMFDSCQPKRIILSPTNAERMLCSCGAPSNTESVYALCHNLADSTCEFYTTPKSTKCYSNIPLQRFEMGTRCWTQPHIPIVKTINTRRPG